MTAPATELPQTVSPDLDTGPFAAAAREFAYVDDSHERYGQIADAVLALASLAQVTDNETSTIDRFAPPQVRWGRVFHDMCEARLRPDGIDIGDASLQEGATDRIVQLIGQLRTHVDEVASVPISYFAEQLFSFPDRTLRVTTKTENPDLESYSATVLGRSRRRLTDAGSVVGLPEETIVPGGRFEAMAGWDSLPSLEGFTSLGAEGFEQLGRELKNFYHIAKEHDGVFPNIGATWALYRMHPNIVPRLVRLYAKTQAELYPERTAVISDEHIELLEMHQAYLNRDAETLPAEPGSANRYLVRMPNGSIMYRFYDDAPEQFGIAWRDEMLEADKHVLHQREVALGRSLTPAEVTKLALDLRASAGSGEDFTAAQCADHRNLHTIHTTDLVSVKQNALQVDAFNTLAFAYYQKAQTAAGVERDAFTARADQYAARAQELAAGIQEYCVTDDGFLGDYDFVASKTEPGQSMGGIFALSSGVLPTEQGRGMLDVVNERFFKAGGFVNTTYESSMQWDGNAWPIMELQAVRGAILYGRSDLASKWTEHLIARNEACFAKHGRLYERFDPNAFGEPGGGGEYENVVDIAMTHGAHLALLSIRKYLDRTMSASVVLAA